MAELILAGAQLILSLDVDGDRKEAIARLRHGPILHGEVVGVVAELQLAHALQPVRTDRSLVQFESMTIAARSISLHVQRQALGRDIQPQQPGRSGMGVYGRFGNNQMKVTGMATVERTSRSFERVHQNAVSRPRQRDRGFYTNEHGCKRGNR